MPVKVPGPVAREEGRRQEGEFVELKNDGGSSLGEGDGVKWVKEGDGLHRLRIPASLFTEPLMLKTIEHDDVEHLKWHDVTHTTTDELRDIGQALEGINGPLSDFLGHVIVTLRSTASPQRLIVFDAEGLLKAGLGVIPDEAFS